MGDIVSPAVRSRMMAGIRSKNTKPEIAVRKGLHARGFRFRLHDRKLPGKPDLVFSKFHAVVFVNGCFWHGHDCHLFRWPKSSEQFWRDKIGKNQTNDEANAVRLSLLGWRHSTVWECEINRSDPALISSKLDELADLLRTTHNGEGR
jgi:DNA mismatch endonuclease, patch repair protein